MLSLSLYYLFLITCSFASPFTSWLHLVWFFLAFFFLKKNEYTWMRIRGKKMESNDNFFYSKFLFRFVFPILFFYMVSYLQFDIPILVSFPFYSSLSLSALKTTPIVQSEMKWAFILQEKEVFNVTMQCNEGKTRCSANLYFFR